MDTLALHITFHYSEARIVYLHKIINEEVTYPFETHVFIHSNKEFSIENAEVVDYFIPLNLKYHLIGNAENKCSNNNLIMIISYILKMIYLCQNKQLSIGSNALHK